MGASVVVVLHLGSAVVVLRPGGGKGGASVVVVLGDFGGIKARPKSSFSTDSFQDKSG